MFKTGVILKRSQIGAYLARPAQWWFIIKLLTSWDAERDGHPFAGFSTFSLSDTKAKIQLKSRLNTVAKKMGVTKQ